MLRTSWNTATVMRLQNTVHYALHADSGSRTISEHGISATRSALSPPPKQLRHFTISSLQPCFRLTRRSKPLQPPAMSRTGTSNSLPMQRWWTDVHNIHTSNITFQAVICSRCLMLPRMRCTAGWKPAASALAAESAAYAAEYPSATRSCMADKKSASSSIMR